MESLKFGFAVDSPYFHAHNPSVKNNAQYGEYYIALKVLGEKLECLKITRQEEQVSFEKIEIDFESIDLYFFYPNTEKKPAPATIDDLENLIIRDWRGCVEYLLDYMGRNDLYDTALEFVYGIEVRPITIIVCEDNEIAGNLAEQVCGYSPQDPKKYIHELYMILHKYGFIGGDAKSYFPDIFDTEIKYLSLPETGLYPSKQSLLADMLIEINKLKSRSVIVHTHSEYLVRKLQVLVKEGKLKPEEIAICHIINDGTIKRIPLFNNGMLKQNFGKGFYDQTNQLVNQLYE